MEMNEVVSRYRTKRLEFYRWMDSTETLHRFMMAFSFACLTGLGALIRVYTPLSPVPFTAQVFFVLLSGAVLGSRYGGVSQLMYVCIGVAGVPWFAGGVGGYHYVMGATGGYLAGFCVAAYLVGLMMEQGTGTRTLPVLVPIMVLGVLAIYGLGATWLAVVLGLTPWEAFALGVAPFIALDLVKALLAAGIGRLVTIRPTP